MKYEYNNYTPITLLGSYDEEKTYFILLSRESDYAKIPTGYYMTIESEDEKIKKTLEVRHKKKLAKEKYEKESGEKYEINSNNSNSNAYENGLSDDNYIIKKKASKSLIDTKEVILNLSEAPLNQFYTIQLLSDYTLDNIENLFNITLEYYRTQIIIDPFPIPTEQVAGKRTLKKMISTKLLKNTKRKKRSQLN